MSPDQLPVEPVGAVEQADLMAGQPESELRRVLVRGPVVVFVEFAKGDPEHSARQEPETRDIADVVPIFKDHAPASRQTDLLNFDDGGLDWVEERGEAA